MDGHTFGFNFEEAFTLPAPGCEGTAGHHRIVNYVGLEFADLVYIAHIFLAGPQWSEHGCQVRG